MSCNSILVTGAAGFVGSAVVRHFAGRPSQRVVAASRNPASRLPANVQSCLIGNIDRATDWSAALAGVDAVVHCAARVHVMNERAENPLAAFRQVNVEGTLALARQAAASGVRRFVFISSIKVNGEQTAVGRPFSADDAPAPLDPYGESKWEAEQQLLALARDTAMEVVIIRPVLVYGPGVKANFHSMMRWLDKRVPLPLGAVDNRRSLVYLGNLVDLIEACIHHPAAANQVFLASDGHDLSTTQLLAQLGQALGRPARLVPVPAAWLALAARLLGKGAVAQRLLGSLQVDLGKNKRLLGWAPPVATQTALADTAKSYRESRRA